MRPKPSMPSVFSYSSTPLNFERSQAPTVSDAWACGTLRASASSSASVCSAAVITFDCGALATMMPRLVAASTSTLSTPTPARADRLQALGPLEQVGGELGGRADQDAVELADAALELAVLPVDAQLDVEAGLAQELDAGVADLLLDEDLGTSRRLRDRHARLEEDALRGGHAGAELELVAELAQRHLERRDRGDDVERAEVAAVRDAGDLALQLALAAGDRDAEAVAHQLGHLARRRSPRAA